MPQTKFTRITAAADDNGHYYTIKTGSGTLKGVFLGANGDAYTGNINSGLVYATLFDSNSAGAGIVIGTFALNNSEFVPIECDFQDGLILAMRSGAANLGAVTITFT